MEPKLDIAYDFLWDFKRKEIIFLVNKKYFEDYHHKIFSIFPSKVEGECLRLIINPRNYPVSDILRVINSIFWDFDKSPKDQLLLCGANMFNEKLSQFLKNQPSRIDHQLSRVLFEALNKIQHDKKLKFDRGYQFQMISQGYFIAYLNNGVDIGPHSVNEFYHQDSTYERDNRKPHQIWHQIAFHNTDSLGVYKLALWCGVAGLCTLYREDQKKNTA